MEEDSKKIIFPSSPTFSFSVAGNNENVSENKRNHHHHQKTNKKVFMAPTFSTASKKKKEKILAELKPQKKGTIPNTTPIKFVSKIPSFSDNNNDDESFVPNSTIVPYDPLTNYLSPRPKFLWYNPNRKRKIVLQMEVESGTASVSTSSSVTSTPTRVSLDSQSSCNVVEQEELIEEEELGWKWVLLKCFFVFTVLVLSTMYISSMNSGTMYHDNSISGMNVEYQDFGNFTFGIVSLRKIDDFGSWGFDKRRKSEMDVSELDQNVGEFEENQEAISPNVDNFGEENMISGFNSETDYPEKIRVFNDLNDDVLTEEKTEVKAIAEPNSEGDEVKNLVHGVLTEAESVVKTVAEPNSEVEVKKLVDDVFTEDKIEVKTVAVPNIEELEVKNLVDDGLTQVKTVDETNLGVDVKILVDDVITDVKNLLDDVFTDVENEKSIVDENHQIVVFQAPIELRINRKYYYFLMVLTACMAFLLVFYCECKKVFLKSNSSQRRLGFQVKRKVSNRSAGRPPRAGNRLVQTHQNSVCDVNVTKVENVERERTPPGGIPAAMQLGEVDFRGKFSGSLVRCDVERGKVQEEESQGSVYSISDKRRVKKSNMTVSTSESAEQEDDKEAGTALRRSKRLQKKGVTSP